MKEVNITNIKTNQKFYAKFEDPTVWINDCVSNNYWGKPERWVKAKVFREFAVSESNPNGWWYPDEFYDEADVLETEIRNEPAQTLQEPDGTPSMIDVEYVKLRAEYTIEITDYVPPVPQEVTMRQARIALVRSNLYHTITDAINNSTDEELKIEWEYSQTVRRNWTNLISVSESLGMTSEQLDELFRLADTL